MKTNFLFISFYILFLPFMTAQIQLNVEGHSKIRGHLNLANSDNDSTSLSIGHLSGVIPGAGSNTFLGYRSGGSGASNFNNTIMGSRAGENNQGFSNSFFGVLVGGQNSGNRNSFFGYQAGLRNDPGKENSFFGYEAGVLNTGGSFNSFFGKWAGGSNGSADHNAFFGYESGMLNEQVHNSFFGSQSGRVNTTGDQNTFVGYQSGFANATGNNNVFVGSGAGWTNETGDFSLAIGGGAASGDSATEKSVYLGYHAGFIDDTPEAGREGNIFIGHQAGSQWAENKNNTLIIENSANDDPLIMGDFSANTLDIHGDLNIRNVFGEKAITIDRNQSRLGIGISLPQAELHVLGDGIFDGFLQLSDVLRLEPYDDSSSTPTCTETTEGSVYYSDTAKTLRVCIEVFGPDYQWKNVQFAGGIGSSFKE